MNALRQIIAVTSIGLRAIPQRLGPSLVVVVGMACVVAVTLSILSLSTGFMRTLKDAGRADRAMVLSRDARYESASSITRDNVPVIIDAPGIRRTSDGKAIASAETLASVPVTKKRDGLDAYLDLRGIALFTESGVTARQLSKYHPTSPIFALSPIEVTINRMNLLWGTTPIRCPKVNSTEALVDVAESLLEQGGYVRPREVIAIVAGTRTKSGSTNFMRLHVVTNEETQKIVRKKKPAAKRGS